MKSLSPLFLSGCAIAISLVALAIAVSTLAFGAEQARATLLSPIAAWSEVGHSAPVILKSGRKNRTERERERELAGTADRDRNIR